MRQKMSAGLFCGPKTTPTRPALQAHLFQLPGATPFSKFSRAKHTPANPIVNTR